MKGIATFFTLFWIIYFPTCIAFNELSFFGIVDEVMTLVLMGYTFVVAKGRTMNHRPRREYIQFLGILAFFVVYGLFFGANIKIAVLRDLVQWIRPFSVIYCTWMLNPLFNKRQRKLMLVSMTATLVAWIFYHPQVTVYGSGAEFPVLGQLAMCTGMAWYIFTKPTKRNAWIALLFVLSGMLAPKFKYLGEVVCFIGMVFLLKSKFNFKSPTTIIYLSIMMVAVLFVTWSKFEVYYVSGFEEDAIEMARPMSYKVAFTQILWDYFPLGPGMGSFGVAAAADFYSPLYYKYDLYNIWGLAPENPMFLADAFYPTLANFGVVGIFFFLVFWKRRLVAFNAIQDLRYYRVAWISFFCLAIEQTADSSFLSGKGMGFCMLIGLCLNANRNMEMMKRAREQRTLEKQEQ